MLRRRYSNLFATRSRFRTGDGIRERLAGSPCRLNDEMILLGDRASPWKPLTAAEDGGRPVAIIPGELISTRKFQVRLPCPRRGRLPRLIRNWMVTCLKHR